MYVFVDSWALGVLICFTHIIHTFSFDYVPRNEYVEYIGATIRSACPSFELSFLKGS